MVLELETFTSTLPNLEGGKTYYLRAYATNNVGTAFGDEVSFITLGQKPIPATISATNISITGATLTGSVNANYLSTTVSFEIWNYYKLRV